MARRGFHITREYATDPLEILFAREVMRTKLVALPAEATIADLRGTLLKQPAQRGQHLYPVVDTSKQLKGVVTRKELMKLVDSNASGSLSDVLRTPVVVYTDEPLRLVVSRMAETSLTRLPVVDRESGELAGMISLRDLLLARVRNLNEERQRERVLQLRLPFGSRVKAGEGEIG